MFIVLVSGCEQQLVVGSTISVPRWTWVDVEQSIRQEYRNGSSTLQKGESCGMKAGGMITIIEFVSEKIVLARYQAPRIPVGTPCPSGVVFKINLDTLNSWR